MFVISGGNDCKLRLWSIKSGELLFEDKFSDSVIFIVCYKTYGHSKHDILSAFLLSILKILLYFGFQIVANLKVYYLVV